MAMKENITYANEEVLFLTKALLLSNGCHQKEYCRRGVPIYWSCDMVNIVS